MRHGKGTQRPSGVRHAGDDKVKVITRHTTGNKVKSLGPGIVAALLLVVAPASAQWVEHYVYLPDSARTVDVCYSPLHNSVYCSDNAGNRIFVINGRNISRTVPGGDAPGVLCYASAVDKVYCANAVSDDVTVIDAATNTVVAQPRVGDYPIVLCHNPVRNKLYCSNFNGQSISVIDCVTDSVIATVPVGVSPYTMCYNSREDKLYCTLYGDDGIAIIDCGTDRLRATVSLYRGSYGICWDSTDSKVYCASSGAYRVYAISGAGDTLTAAVRTVDHPYLLTYNPLANRVYCSSSTDWHVTVIDCSSDSAIARVPSGGDPGHLIWTRRDRIYCSNYGDSSLGVIDCPTNRVIAEVHLDGMPSRLAYNSTGDRVYVALKRPGYGGAVASVYDPMGAVEEHGPLQGPAVTRRTGNATVVAGGVLFITETSGHDSQTRSLHDAAGRKVLDLRPGANDVSRLAPGVYFIQSLTGRRRTSAARLVLAR